MIYNSFNFYSFPSDILAVLCDTGALSEGEECVSIGG